MRKLTIFLLLLCACDREASRKRAARKLQCIDICSSQYEVANFYCVDPCRELSDEDFAKFRKREL